jgi:hypothetical protein
MANLTNTQLMVLTHAAQREDGAAIVPERMGAAAIRKNSEALVVRKLMREVLTKPGMPIWRKAEDGRSISLVILKAGRDLVSAKSEAFHTDPGFLVTNQSVAAPHGDSAATKAVAQPRSGSKLARVIALLSKDAGASLKALAEATGWLPHTTRAALTGLRKRGFEIGRVKDNRLGAVYRLASEPKVTAAA